MAKENIVFLYGYVEEKEKQVLESGREDGLSFQIKTIRTNKNGMERYDTPILLTQDKEIMEDCKEIQPGDMVSVKGTLRSISHENGTSEVVVNILWIHKMESQVDLVTADILLHKNAEISNNVFFFGTVCKKTNYYSEEGKTSSLSFQVASNRRRPVIGDEEDNRTDYLWIRSFGKIADQASNAIDINSELYISGYIQTRMIQKNEMDLETGKMVKVSRQITEIVPYSIEYLRNCNIKVSELGIAEKYHLMEEKLRKAEEKIREVNQSEFFMRRICMCLLGDTEAREEDLNELIRKTYQKVCH